MAPRVLTPSRTGNIGAQPSQGGLDGVGLASMVGACKHGNTRLGVLGGLWSFAYDLHNTCMSLEADGWECVMIPSTPSSTHPRPLHTLPAGSPGGPPALLSCLMSGGVQGESRPEDSSGAALTTMAFSVEAIEGSSPHPLVAPAGSSEKPLILSLSLDARLRLSHAAR